MSLEIQRALVFALTNIAAVVSLCFVSLLVLLQASSRGTTFFADVADEAPHVDVLHVLLHLLNVLETSVAQWTEVAHFLKFGVRDRILRLLLTRVTEIKL